MRSGIRTILPALLVVGGVGLMVAGIITGKLGAVVVGLCVAVAATYHWMDATKRAGKGG
ncbi:MAG TPA: hypothetical protein PKO09_05935 [Anaerolineae bacterium]|nr:hypothetical protein [Anaerolineae bacterium]